ncbi:MAG: sulfatase family protein [Niabella sp.]
MLSYSLQNLVRTVQILLIFLLFSICLQAQQKPNVIIIYADDLGFGDISCNGAIGINTPNIDALANKGIRFTNAHTTSSTCTPSRYSLMTGEYPWRKKGTGVLPGNAALIVPTDKLTLPGVFQKQGYTTGIVGKWHLGLGTTVEKNWNELVTPGPNQVGFNYSFIFPATADRVPTIFMENQKIINPDPADPVEVNYGKKIGDDPTGKEHPELLKMKPDPRQGHANTIVNGIGRIGFMTGGKLARWTDEELGFTFLEKAKEFIVSNSNKPFFLCYNLTEPHAPRMPATMCKGTSKMGLRGEAILQIEWAVGEHTKELKRLKIDKNTIVIVTSDNGPVLNDGYLDKDVELNGDHKPAGPFRGGKYSVLEGGTRVPFIVSWPSKIRKTKVSNALVCQMDLLASFAAYFKLPIPAGNAHDSKNVWKAFTGADMIGRSYLVEHSINILAIVQNGWKLIPANNMNPYFATTYTETGGSKEDQLYNLNEDWDEKNNLAAKYPEKVKVLQELLDNIKAENSNN